MKLIRELFGYSGPVGLGAAIRILLLDIGVFAAVIMTALVSGGNLVRPGLPSDLGVAIIIVDFLMLPFMAVSLVVRLLQNIAIFVPKPAAAAVPDGRADDGAAAAGLGNRNPGKPMTKAQWAVILILFSIVMIIQPARIIRLFWYLLWPASYAAHMYNDEDLANAAAHDQRMVKLLLARAEGGDRSAMYFYGSLYDTGNCFYTPSIPRKNPALAISWYQRAVALDDQGAERNLGIDYYEGAGVPQDYNKAAQLLEMAAAKNDDFGDYYLGIMLEHGQGEPINLNRAFNLEQASAVQGFVAAEREVGSMYFAGNGVAKNTTMAIYFWKLAAERGDAEAKKRLTQTQ